MLDINAPVQGNEAVVKFLEEQVAEARLGRSNHVCIITCVDGEVKAGFVGVTHMEPIAYYGAALLQKKLMEASQGRMSPVWDNVGAANRRIFNLAKMPISFDFAAALIDAEMTRVRAGVPGPLRVAWHFAEGQVLTAEEQQRFNGILRPLMQLIGAVEDQNALQGGRYYNDIANLRCVVEAHRRGEAVPKFVPPKPHVDAVAKFVSEACGKPPVTITLREAGHTAYRNSKLSEWLQLARWLQGRGEKVIIIRDTAKAKEPLDVDLRICPEASEDLLIRCALYEAAKINLFVANGPVMLAVFGNRPWLMFNEVQDERDYKANTSEGWIKHAGIAPLEQWPWTRSDQRIIWHRDDFEPMRDAYIEHFG